jgi:hypothetical protein
VAEKEVAFELGGRSWPRGTEEAVVDEPPGPINGIEIDVLDARPRPSACDELGLV